MKNWILKNKKKVIALIILFIIISVGFVGCNQLKKQISNNLNMIIPTADVKKGNIVVEVNGSGAVDVVERKTIKAAENAKVKKVLVKEGDFVKKGQVIITFQEKDLTEQIKQEQLNIDRQNLEIENLQERFKSAARIQVDSSEVDDIKLNFKKAEIALNQSESRIKQYQNEQKSADSIVALIDGQVTKLNVQANEMTTMGTDIMEIVNFNSLETVIKVDEMDIAQIKKGQEASVTLDALPYQTFKGKVTDISQEGVVKDGVSVFEVTIQLLENEKVRSGMSTQVTIPVQEKKDILVLPIEAVEQLKGENIVYIPASPSAGAIATENKVKKKIEVGIHNQDMIEIVSGLKEGESVLLPLTTKTQLFPGQMTAEPAKHDAMGQGE